MFEMV